MTLVHSVLEHDGLALRELTEDDAELVSAWMGHERTAGMFNTTMRRDELPSFLAVLRERLWSRPMAALRDGRPVGALLNPLVEVNSLNSLLVVLLEDPVRDRLALPLYVRHLFWSSPLHRVFAEVPAFAEQFRGVFAWAGFEEEGVLTDHLRVAGRFHPVCVYGLLRPDFDRWAARELPLLSLPAAP